MYWVALYLMVYSSAVLIFKLALMLKLHFFFWIVIVAALSYLWWWWQSKYGEINPTVKELYLQTGLIPIVVTAWLIAWFR